MDWTHALVALVSATLGAAAHKMYAWYTRKNYWSDLNLALLHGTRRSRRRHSLRMKPRFGYTLFYGRPRDRHNPLFD